MALRNIQPNSPCDLFAIRFVWGGFLPPFLLPTAPIVAAGANYCPLEKWQNKQSACALVYLCTSVQKCIHSFVHASQSSGPGDSPEDSPGKLHLLRASFHLSCSLQRTSRHLTHSSSPRTLPQPTRLLFRHYVQQKCSGSPVVFFF